MISKQIHTQTVFRMNEEHALVKQPTLLLQIILCIQKHACVHGIVFELGLGTLCMTSIGFASGYQNNGELMSKPTLSYSPSYTQNAMRFAFLKIMDPLSIS